MSVYGKGKFDDQVSQGSFEAVNPLLLAGVTHQGAAAPDLKDARRRFSRVGAGGERRKHGHLIHIAIPAAQQATVFELFRLAPELDDARDLDDFVCTANRIGEWTFRWNA